MNPPGTLVLERIEGPESDDVAALLEASPKQSVTVGRARDCRLCLPDPTVSRHHASITSRGGRWFVRDLESRHGTILNAVPIDPAGAAMLDSGDLLRIGPWTFRVMIAGQEPAQRAITMTESDDREAATLVTRVEAAELAQHRLHLLLDAAARINTARSEAELCESVVNSALSGSGFERAAVIRHHDGFERVEVLFARSRSAERVEPSDFTFSRSLLRAAAGGQVARLASRDQQQPVGVSIVELGITAALCAPVMLGGAIAAYLYLDARGRRVAQHHDAGPFCEAISRMCGMALANLKRIDLEQRQRTLEAELNAAREAQSLIVPAAQREFAGIEYAMRMQPGSFVAGDLFDVVSFDESRIGVFIGDVTGEGVGSAILMASAQAHLHAGLVRFNDPAEALNEVDRYVSERSPMNKFISMWVGVFDSSAAILRYADAGHGHWLIRRAAGTFDNTPLPTGTLIGISSGMPHSSRDVTLSRGDRIVLYSDGIVEQIDSEGEQFGRERVCEALKDSRSAEEDVDRIFAAVIRHGGSPQLADDATVASIAVR